MTARKPLDPDAIPRAEAAEILGVSETTVARWRREGLLVEIRGGRRLYSRTEVNDVRDNPWITGRKASSILGISHVRVSQLAKQEKIPVHVTRSGKRVYRQLQIEIVANARKQRSR